MCKKAKYIIGTAVLRIRDVYPGSDFFPSRIRTVSIPDPGSRGQKGTGSRIRIRNTDRQTMTKVRNKIVMNDLISTVLYGYPTGSRQ